MLFTSNQSYYYKTHNYALKVGTDPCILRLSPPNILDCLFIPHHRKHNDTWFGIEAKILKASKSVLEIFKGLTAMDALFALRMNRAKGLYLELDEIYSIHLEVTGDEDLSLVKLLNFHYKIFDHLRATSYHDHEQTLYSLEMPIKFSSPRCRYALASYE